MASDSLEFDPARRHELPKLEAVEHLRSAVGTGPGEIAVDVGGLGGAVIDVRPGVSAVDETGVLDLEVVRPHAERSTAVATGWWQLAVKRLLDVVVSAPLLVLILPLLLVVAVAVGVSSRGPIVFRQRRIGRDGKPFGMWKFRSMYRDAHDGRDELLHLNEATGPVFKIRDDPRVTRVGRVIRRWSIDELPQLLNVVVGQMSLVGPRPPLPEEYESYGARERGRLRVKPGLTCIWQVSGRSELDFDTWVEMDLEYIASWSLALDLKLLVQTLPAVLRGRGAY